MGVNQTSFGTPREELGVAFMEHVADAGEFIGLEVFPTARVRHKAADFSAITRESLLQDVETARAKGSTYNRADIGAKDKSFNCKEHGIEVPVDASEKSLYMNDFDVDDAATKIGSEILMRRHEKRVAAAVQDTVLFTGAAYFTDFSASPWATIATDIIGQIVDKTEVVRQNCGRKANALVIGAGLVPALLKNTGIRAQLPATPIITHDLLKAALPGILGLQRIIIGGAVRNSAIEGQAAVVADIWGNTYAMLAVIADKGAPMNTPCLGRTMLWVPDSPNEVMAESYPENQSRSEVFRFRHHVDELLLDKNFGHLMDVKA